MIDGEEKLWLKSPNIKWINKYIIAIYSIVSLTRIEIRSFIYLFVKWTLSIGFLMRFSRWIKYLDNSWKKGKFPISVIFLFLFFILNTISLNLEFLNSWWQSKLYFDLVCYTHAFAGIVVKRLVSKEGYERVIMVGQHKYFTAALEFLFLWGSRAPEKSGL